MSIHTTRDLTKGSILKTMLLFAAPMILGNLLQQIYNITDTIIVGHFIGARALAAVGAAYTLMTFLTSVIIGLCMGSGSLFSMLWGAGKKETLRETIWTSFLMIAVVTGAIYAIVYAWMDTLLSLLQIPRELYTMMRSYTGIVLLGLGFIFLYNYFAYGLRAMGDSMTPLLFLLISTVLNISLDLWFVTSLEMEVEGAALATVIAQGVAGVGIALYAIVRVPFLRPSLPQKPGLPMLGSISKHAFLTCIQQSVMNFGILMIQGLVNSFGTTVMAAFAAAVKIDTLAYMPAQEFGNAFSLFVSQNHGAGQRERVRDGTKLSVYVSVLFCLCISAFVWLCAQPLMRIFVKGNETAIIAEGIRYLRIEGAFYWGIGCLFLLYGLYRAIGKPEMSLLLTVISLGTRVLLAYLFAPRTPLGPAAIWWAIPIGWVLADAVGYLYYKRRIYEKK